MKHTLSFSGQPSSRGFTLIELSIVLIVIGLLVAGIVGGQSLISQARLRSVVSEINTFKTAIHIFNLEYDDLPGDLENATDYWPDSAGYDTENGDGNGVLPFDSTDPIEELNAYEHLFLADIMPGEYTGLLNGSLVSGSNVPESRWDGGVYRYRFHQAYNRTGMGIQLGAINQTSQARGPVMTAREAESIDRKIDDGASEAGVFIAMHGEDDTGSDVAGCVTGNDQYPGGSTTYDLTSNVQSCRVWWWMNR